MLKRRFAIALAGLIAHAGHAQGPEPIRWRFSTEVLQDMMLHLNARAYAVRGRWSIGVHGGFRPSLSRGGVVKPGNGRIGEYENIHWRNWILNAYTIGPCFRLDSKSGNGSYMELDGFYRVWSLDRRNVRYNNAEDVTFDGIRSERTDVLAVRLLWGTAPEPRFKAGRNSARVLEFFGGVGYRWKSGSWTMHTGTYQGDSVNDFTGATEEAMPTLHVGIRLTHAIRKHAEQR